MAGLKSVKFVKHSTPYAAGDIAGFAPEVADKYIAEEVAVEYKAKEAKTEEKGKK